MFTIQERNSILQQLVNHFSKKEEVLAICLVGSNATGNDDEYSDLDFSILIKNKDIKNLWQNFYEDVGTNNQIFRKFKVSFSENSYLVGLFLDNGLEMDVGFCSTDEFINKNNSKPNLKYLVKYKKENFKFPKTINTFASFNGVALLEKADSDIWYNFKNAMFALKRGKIFRSLKEIEDARNEIVMCLTALNNLEGKHFKQVDNLSEELKNKIESTYPKTLNYSYLKDSLLSTMNLFFDLL